VSKGLDLFERPFDLDDLLGERQRIVRNGFLDFVAL
jgi:hypothetical protein